MTMITIVGNLENTYFCSMRKTRWKHLFFFLFSIRLKKIIYLFLQVIYLCKIINIFYSKVIIHFMHHLYTKKSFFIITYLCFYVNVYPKRCYACVYECIGDWGVTYLVIKKILFSVVVFKYGIISLLFS